MVDPDPRAIVQRSGRAPMRGSAGVRGLEPLEHREVLDVQGHEVGPDGSCGCRDQVVDQIDPGVGPPVSTEESAGILGDLIGDRHDRQRVEEAPDTMSFARAHPALDLDPRYHRHERGAAGGCCDEEVGGFGPPAEVVDRRARLWRAGAGYGGHAFGPLTQPCSAEGLPKYRTQPMRDAQRSRALVVESS